MGRASAGLLRVLLFEHTFYFHFLPLNYKDKNSSACTIILTFNKQEGKQYLPMVGRERSNGNRSLAQPEVLVGLRGGGGGWRVIQVEGSIRFYSICFEFRFLYVIWFGFRFLYVKKKNIIQFQHLKHIQWTNCNGVQRNIKVTHIANEIF